MAFTALAVGAIALGALTPPDPEATAEPADVTEVTADRSFDPENFTFSQIATGEPLRWEHAGTFDHVQVGSLVAHESWLYLFGFSDPYQGGGPGGLMAWRSGDGIGWEALGRVVEAGHQIGSVTSTPQGLIALETVGDSDGFTIWRSDDAIRWTPETIPADTGSEHARIYAHTVAGTDRLLAVAGDIQIDVSQLLEERMEQDLGAPIDISPYGWSHRPTEKGLVFSAYGPLGLIAFEMHSGDLGLTEEEIEWVITGYGPGNGAEIWVLQEEGGWRHSVSGERGAYGGVRWIEALVVRPDDTLLAYEGAASWSSVDGLTWSLEPVWPRPYRVEPWGERYVGLSSGEPDVLTSIDAASWESSGLSELMPFGLGWGAGPLGAGPAGVAVAIEVWGGYDALNPAFEPPRLTDGDATLTLNPEVSRFELEVDGSVRSWTMYGNIEPDDIVVDIVTETVTFLDQGSGSDLASFSFDEIRQAEDSYWQDNNHQSPQVALAFSADGITWSIQDITADMGDEAWIADLAVTEDRVVALSSATNPWDPGQLTEFEIWAGALP